MCGFLGPDQRTAAPGRWHWTWVEQWLHLGGDDRKCPEAEMSLALMKNGSWVSLLCVISDPWLAGKSTRNS